MWFACLVSAAGCSQAPATGALQALEEDRDHRFRIQASPIEMLEGGPLVLKVTLSYEGADTVPRCLIDWFFDPQIDTPAAWGKRPLPEVIDGSCDEAHPVRRGEIHSEVVSFSYAYPHITAGRHRLVIRWPVYQAREGEEHLDGFQLCKPSRKLATPSVVYDADVPPATPENVAALRRRLEARLDAPKKTEPGSSADPGVYAILDHVKHSGLAPLAWRRLEGHPEFSHAPDVFDLANNDSQPATDTDNRFAKLADDHAFKSCLNLFDFLRQRSRPLSNGALASLMGSESIWTRALTYVSFPTQCPKAWVAFLMADLRDHRKPLPAADFSRLLRQLNDDDFRVRQKATADLARQGKRAEGQLRESLRSPLPPEAEKRVRGLLEPLDKRDDFQEGKAVVSRLTLMPGSAARGVLEALAAGEPWDPLTRTATFALQERNKKLSQEP